MAMCPHIATAYYLPVYTLNYSGHIWPPPFVRVVFSCEEPVKPYTLFISRKPLLHLLGKAARSLVHQHSTKLPYIAAIELVNTNAMAATPQTKTK